jgi:hypothetical protein
MNPEQKSELIVKSGFKCQKCGYYSPVEGNLDVTRNIVLCSICSIFAPEDNKFEQYILEKVDWNVLEPFRKYYSGKLNSNQKKGMMEKYKQGNLMARPAFGYKVIRGKMEIEQEDAERVKDIFSEFLKGVSLNQIAIKYGFSVNGIKKILKNFTYIGKIKFNSQIIQGSHQQIISPEIFNNVQTRFEDLEKARMSV